MIGLGRLYSNNHNFSVKMHLSALTFFPAGEIPGEFNELKLNLPKEASRIND